MRQLVVGNLGKKIRLVFDGVFGRGEEKGAVFLFDGGVMSGGGLVEILSPALFEETEFYELVAHHVGVWCKPFCHCVEGVGHDVVPIFLVE